MKWFNTMAILIAAYLAVFFQATFNELRHWVGVQIDLLPAIVVFASLSSGIVTLTVVCICGGLWADSLSANPLGISMLPLFLVGLLIHRSRDYILRDQPFAQFVLGTGATAGASLLTVLMVINTNAQPLVGWFSLWQWFVLSLVGGGVTPLWFRFFDWARETLNYRPLGETSFRADREIKRGR
jgi:hypothetical protein